MVVEEGPNALSAKVKGSTFYFCSESCLREYTMPERELARLKLAVGTGVGLTIPILFLTYVPFFNPVTTDYILLVLALPVQFVVGARFYKGAFHALKARSGNMDVLVDVGTTAAFAFSALVALYPSLSGVQGVYFDAAAVIVTLVLLGKLLEHTTKARASRALRTLLELRPAVGHLKTGERFEDVQAENLQIGDVVEVKPGERFPTDGLVTNGRSSADESLLTGEGAPVPKEVGSHVISGSINLNGALLVNCTAVGEKTVLGQIVKLVDEASAGKAPIQRLADRVAEFFVPVVLIIAGSASAGWYYFGGVPASTAVLVFVSVVIIACPCALGIATPAALLVGTGIAAKRGILVKGGDAVEASANVDTVLLDKTGTITEGKQSVVTVFGDNEAEILKAAASIEAHSEHTIGKAIVKAAESRGMILDRVQNFLASPGLGVSGIIDERKVLVGRKEFVGIEGPWNGDEAVSKLRKEGNTVVYVTKGREYGAIAIGDNVKADAKKSIADMAAMGLSVMMLTGDNQSTAEAVAKKTGVTQFKAGLLPSDKKDIVEKLQSEWKVVAMVGDGVNDAPAIATADLGLAIGSGTDAAKETGGMVLVREELGDAVEAIKIGRATMRKIRQNLAWAFGYNVILIPVAAGALIPLYGIGVYSVLPFLSGAAMAFSSASVVSNSLLLMRFSPSKKSTV
jgi:Cu+-exporting ATPase